MDLLYQTLISPIQAGMHFVLSATYLASGNKGLSIFFLSFIVNLFLFPLLQMAEKWQEAERQFQIALKPKLQEFRKAFSGEERHSMIHTLYRQTGYHPIYAMRTSLGFLVQVPFFIAAYQLLSDYQPFKGVPFLLVEDLSKPDRLLWGISLLPFVMTVVNLSAAFVYTQKLSLKDKIQPLVISLFFLVLLFNSPAGLLLYWTFNNIFSLVRNIVSARLNPISKRGSSQSRPIMAILQEPFVELAHNFSRWGNKITTPTWFRIMLFILLLDRLYYVLWFDPSSAQHHIALKECIAILIYLCITMLSTFISSFTRSREDYIRVGLLTILFLATTAIAANSILGLDLFQKPYDIKQAIVTLLFLVLLVSAIRLESNLNWKQHLALAVSSIMLASIFFLYNPLFVYTSSPERIGTISADHIQGFLIQAGFIAFCLFSLSFMIGSYFKTRTSILYVTGISWLALVSFFNGYVLTFDYGLFRGDRFTEDALLFSYAQIAALPELLILILLFYGLYRIISSKPMLVPIFFTIMLFFLSKYLIVQFQDQNGFPMAGSAAVAQSMNVERNSSPLSPEKDMPEIGSFRFSKTQQNIIFLVPDAGAGYVFAKLFDSHSSLENDLDGFTFYPNAISSSAFTLPSTAALIAGPKFTPLEINKNPGPTLEQHIINAYQWMINQLEAKHYDITIVNPSYVSCISIDPHSTIQCIDIHSMKDKTALYKKYEITGDVYFGERLLSLFSIFKSLPLALKPLLYKSQYWSQVLSDSAQQNEAKNTYLYYSYLKSLPELSYVDQNGGSSQFIHLWTSDLISPFLLDEGCARTNSENSIVFGKEKREIASFCHLKAIAGWLEWMKKEDVYDNTKIIIAADHGAETFGPTWFSGAVNPLILVKDFGTRGRLKKSQSLIYNADAISLICSGMGGCEGIEPDPTKHPIEKRKLIYSLTRHGNLEYARRSNRFEITNNYVFTEDTIKNPDWRKLIQKELIRQ